MSSSPWFLHLAQRQLTFRRILLAAVVLLAVAYISHLGYLEIDVRTDETRRALVTLEMMQHKQYLAPTLNGEAYLNKPPLYNWIIAASYRVFGINTFALRFPVIVFTFLFGWVIYRFVKKYWNPYAAALAALFFMTNGRILIYDSLQGLIDIGYSMLVYAGFMCIYHFGVQQRWWALFISSYLLAAAGFMMKGLPSVVFQGIGLLVYFGWIERRWKPLFSLAHAVGIGLFTLLVGGYFVAYFQQVSISPAQFFANLLEENTKRTLVASTPMQTLVHVLTYPFTLIYHFAPWALLMVLLVRRQLLAGLRQQGFIWYNALCFFGGLLIYWLSPNIMARYLFMILPLLYTVLLYLYAQDYPNGRVRQVTDVVLMAVVGLLAVGCLALPFVPITAAMPWAWAKALVLSGCLGACTWMAWKQPALRLAWLVLAIVVMRFGFNWFVVENRGAYQLAQKQEAAKVIALAAGRPLVIERHANVGNTDGLSYHHLVQTGRILPLKTVPEPGDIVVTDSLSAQAYPHRFLYTWPGHIQEHMWLVERIR